jgi:4-amino-4-deoxy-L-arabinose transferase-like glycosyltransferase
MGRNSRAWWAAAVLLVARTVGLVASVSSRAPLTGDEPIYDRVARHLLAGLGYSNSDVPWVWKPPGWPITLAGIYATFGDARRTVVLFQGLFDCGTALLTGWIASRVFASRRAGWIAFVLAALWPPFFRESRFMQTEPLFTVCVTLMVAAFVRFAESPSAARALRAGLAAGLASLVRPNGLAPLVGLLAGWILHRRRDLVRDVPRLAVLALGIALMLTPWTLRNARAFHAFIPVSTGAGELFYMGSTFETDGRWDNTQWAGLRGRVLETEERRLGHALDAVEVDRALLRAGLEMWRTDPGRSAEIAAKRLWRLWFLPVVSGSQSVVRIAFFAVLLALYALALPAGLAGLRAPATPRALAGVMLVALVVNGFALTVFLTNSRFIEPVRPLVFVLAAGTVAGWIERRKAPTAG